MITDTPTINSRTLSEPRITYERFLALLKTKNSPAVPEARDVYDILIEQFVEPAFALAQFRVESQYGTDGWAEETGSWGNMLYSENLTILTGPTVIKTDSAGHKYKFATYDRYVDAISDYCRYIHWYNDEYELDTIYEATGRWLGLNRTGDAGHVRYVTTIIDDMIAYQFPPGDFYETGDDMIWAGEYINRTTGKLNKTIYVTKGTPLYRGTTGALLKNLDPAIDPATGKRPAGLHLFFLGPVNDSWEWGAVIVGTSSADPKGTVVYIQNPDRTKIKTVA